jgi:hypothetical protein
VLSPLRKGEALSRKKLSRRALAALVVVCVALSGFTYYVTIRPLSTSRVMVDETIVFLTYLRQNRTISLTEQCIFCRQVELSIPVNWSNFLQPFLGHWYQCQTTTVFNVSSLTVTSAGPVYLKSVTPNVPDDQVWGNQIFNVTLSSNSSLPDLGSPITVKMDMTAVNLALSSSCGSRGAASDEVPSPACFQETVSVPALLPRIGSLWNSHCK